LKDDALYTVKLTFNASGDAARKILSTAWLFKVACHRVLNLSKSVGNTLIPSKVAWIKMFKDYAYSVIPNKRYSYGAVYLVYGVWESARKLKINYNDVELSDWLMFQHYEREVDGNVVRVFGDGSALVTVYGYDGSKDRILIRAKPNRGQHELLGKIVESKEKYMPRIVIRDYGVRSEELYVRGEIHISVSYDFYLKHAKRYGEPRGSLIGGIDVNTDKINLAIIDENGVLRDRKTFWFEEASRKGCPRRRAWSIIGVKVHEMLKYAYHHGVSILAVENPEILGVLKLFWIRSGERKSESYNWRVAVFRSKIVEMIAMKAQLYSIEVRYVDPRGTTNSEEHDEAMKRLGLDRHTASAYLIARRLLNK